MEAITYEISQNKYGDYVITCHNNEQLLSFLNIYDSTKSTAIRLPFQFPNVTSFFNHSIKRLEFQIVNDNNSNDVKLPFDFDFIVTCTSDNSINKDSVINIYGNDVIRNKCPVVNPHGIFELNEIAGSTLIVIITTPSNLRYALIVKDRTKPYLTNPTGTCNKNETYLDCAIRETYEETGIKINSKIAAFGEFEFDHWCYGVKFLGKTKAFYCCTELSDDTILNYQYQDHEIEKIYFAPVNEDYVIQKVDGIDVSLHHSLLISYITNKLQHKDFDWKSQVPSYIKNMNLY